MKYRRAARFAAWLKAAAVSSSSSKKQASAAYLMTPAAITAWQPGGSMARGVTWRKRRENGWRRRQAW